MSPLIALLLLWGQLPHREKARNNRGKDCS